MDLFAKDPIYLKEYENDAAFWLLEAKNNWIVFRTQPSSHLLPGETKPRPSVDLILLGAMFIELPTCICGLSITKPKDGLSRIYAEKHDKGFELLGNNERVYAIESAANRFHIVAANLWIHVHKKRIFELPIQHFYDGEIESYNKYLDKFVEEWIKIE